ncbi:uncharacterized protein LOC102671167 [Apis dorsata]|uniref:uncharacterized protein LOC102671167 n=1 Tax=Apis dorsata TaxID=7462 RepID=UPI0003DF5EDE|nr:uncharacterized protein LOC102671167 [Apis dorsata]
MFLEEVKTECTYFCYRTIADLSNAKNNSSTEYADTNKQILTTSLTCHYAAVMDGEGTLGRGHGNGGRGLRRQRSLEWRERRGYGALERLHHELFDTSRKKEKGYDMAFWNENTQGTGGNPNEKPINHVVFNEPSCFYAHPWE